MSVFESIAPSLDLHGGPCAVIDCAALRHNLEVVRALAPSSRVMAVIKANAYGHGIVPVAQSLPSADAFGVARLKEAIALRDAGIEQRIVLLEGVYAHQDIDVAASRRLELVIHCQEQLRALEEWTGSAQFTVWCKVDTGMNRLGFPLEQFADALARLQRCSNVQIVRLMTHLADADDQDGVRTREQLARFRHLCSVGSGLERSIGNSAGLIAWPDARVEWVRPGLMLYGMSPFSHRTAADLQLKPVMTLMAPLIALRHLKAGEEVGYGGTWRAAKDALLGIAAVGYGDGYPRHARTGTPVVVNGRVVPLVGRVSMDMVAIDLTSLHASANGAARVGDLVTLWGQGLPAERVAGFADTIPYELVCAISQRVAMRYV